MENVKRALAVIELIIYANPNKRIHYREFNSLMEEILQQLEG